MFIVDFAEAFKALPTFDLEDGQPKREISVWGNKCPVGYRENGAPVVGSTNHVVTYQGKIYFCASKENAEKLSARPDLYLSQSPSYARLGICVIGGLKTGKSGIARRLASHYGLTLVDVHALVDLLATPEGVAQLGTLGDRVNTLFNN